MHGSKLFCEHDCADHKKYLKDANGADVDSLSRYAAGLLKFSAHDRTKRQDWICLKPHQRTCCGSSTRLCLARILRREHRSGSPNSDFAVGFSWKIESSPIAVTTCEELARYALVVDLRLKLILVCRQVGVCAQFAAKLELLSGERAGIIGIK